MLLTDQGVEHQAPDNQPDYHYVNPAVRLVEGSPILTARSNKNTSEMMESPLFIPKRKKLSTSEEEEETVHHQPYSGHTEPYENVILSTVPYQHRPKQGVAVVAPQHHDKSRGLAYENMDHVTFAAGGAPGRRKFTRYLPQRQAPAPPRHPERYRLGPPEVPPERYRLGPPEVPRRGRTSPGDTSGYSSYEQNTLSLNRLPTSPLSSMLPTMNEEITLSTGYLHIEPPLYQHPGYHSNHPTLTNHSNHPTLTNHSNHPTLTNHSNHPTLTNHSNHPTLTNHSNHPTLTSLAGPYKPPHTLTSLPATTLDRSHHKYLINQAILRQYFCIALSTCLLCPPCGYWALYQAFKVDDLVDRGNLLGAERLARKIRRYSVVIVVVGLFWVTLTALVFFLLLNKFKK